MARVKDSEIRNIAFCGHGSAGKTTLVDSLLVTAGAVSGTPSVEAGTSICDFDPEEQQHKHSIESAIVHCAHDGHHFNLIDTPGYPDFVGQVIGALRAVETAAVCINAHAGVQSNTRRVWDEAEKAGVPRVIVLTKLDDEQANFADLLHDLRELWGPGVVAFNVPLGRGGGLRGVASALELPGEAADAAINLVRAHEHLVEGIVEADEGVMERYFEGQMPSEAELAELLPKAIAGGSLTPVFCTAASRGIGLDELLAGLAVCGRAPCAIKRSGKKDGETVSVACDSDSPLVAQVFKTRIDPFVQKLSYLRIFSGRLAKDQTVPVSGVRKDVRMGPLLDVQGAETQPVDEATAGDIVAVAKMDDLHTGTSLGEVELPKIPFPQPMVGLAISAKKRGDENKLATALHKLLEEDPTLRLDRDAQTGEMVISGMTELHLQTIRERLARRDHLEIDTHDPKIPYRETVTQPAEGSYRHKKQSGGRGQFGEVHIRMMPLPRDIDLETFATKDRFPSMRATHYDEENNFLWIDSIVGGTIPGNFMPAIEKGFKERMARGVIAGCRVQDVCVEVHYGKHHPVDSSEAAFKTAGSICFRDVFLKASPALLEPVVTMDITVPDENVGDVYGDMSSRGGRVLGSDPAGGGLQVIHCEVPLRAVSHYNRTLSSMTGGQGSYSLAFSHYEPVPGNVQQEVMSETKVAEEVEA